MHACNVIEDIAVSLKITGCFFIDELLSSVESTEKYPMDISTQLLRVNFGYIFLSVVRYGVCS